MITEEKASSPFGWALSFVVGFAALYEPLRQNLVHNQKAFDVGGVGGVGGLANLAGASATQFGHGILKCSSYHGRYCYEKGDIGPFTPFSVITILFWVGPLLVACGIMLFCRDQSPHNSTTLATPEAPAASSIQQPLCWLNPVWP